LLLLAIGHVDALSVGTDEHDELLADMEYVIAEWGESCHSITHDGSAGAEHLKNMWSINIPKIKPGWTLARTPS